MLFIVNRWKGENVSTAEVGDILTLVDCIKEANVYGVEVPGNRSVGGVFTDANVLTFINCDPFISCFSIHCYLHINIVG